MLMEKTQPTGFPPIWGWAAQVIQQSRIVMRPQDSYQIMGHVDFGTELFALARRPAI